MSDRASPPHMWGGTARRVPLPSFAANVYNTPRESAVCKLGCMASMCNDPILEVKYLGLVSMFDLELED
jgi:hypothetical protein